MPAQEHPFRIQVLSLSEAQHRFELPLDARLREGLEDEALFDDVAGSAQVLLTKSKRMLEVSLTLEGTLTLPCDRCLAPYPQAVALQHRLVYAYDDEATKDDREAATEDEDLVLIPRSQQYIDLGSHLYDLLSLQIPFRRVPEGCPTSDCPDDLIRQYEVTDPGSQTEEAPAPGLDPRWEKLQNLRNRFQS